MEDEVCLDSPLQNCQCYYVFIHWVNRVLWGAVISKPDLKERNKLLLEMSDSGNPASVPSCSGLRSGPERTGSGEQSRVWSLSSSSQRGRLPSLRTRDLTLGGAFRKTKVGTAVCWNTRITLIMSSNYNLIINYNGIIVITHNKANHVKLFKELLIKFF